MKIYAERTVSLFGESCLDIMDKNLDHIVSLGDTHADKMREMGFDPHNDIDIVKFLKFQYSEQFPSNKKIELIYLD